MGKPTRRRDPERERRRSSRGPDGTMLLSMVGGILAILVAAGGVSRWMTG